MQKSECGRLNEGKDSFVHHCGILLLHCLSNLVARSGNCVIGSTQFPEKEENEATSAR